jgi:hypothetical protein
MSDSETRALTDGAYAPINGGIFDSCRSKRCPFEQLPILAATNINLSGFRAEIVHKQVDSSGKFPYFTQMLARCPVRSVAIAAKRE